LAKEKGLKLSVFQNRRWDSDLKTVQQVISDEVLGDIVTEFHFLTDTAKLSQNNTKETALGEILRKIWVRI
jgi:predicted dehydrogenase